jgi:polyisoprenoid-binding protein YceI
MTGQNERLWVIDSQYSSIQFAIKLMSVFTVTGSFTGITGTIKRDELDIGNSSVDLVINTATIDTGNKRRDAHLRSSDFLDVKKYPEITFRSVSVKRGSDRDTLEVTGQLTVGAKSRELRLTVEEVDRSRSPRGEDITYYVAVTEIDRFDFGIKRNRLLIGRKLKITVQVQSSQRG